MHPPTITHEHMSQTEYDTTAIEDGLVRLPVGIAHPLDIMAGLNQVLAKL